MVSPPFAGGDFNQIPIQVPKMSHHQVLEAEEKAQQFAKACHSMAVQESLIPRKPVGKEHSRMQFPMGSFMALFKQRSATIGLQEL